jgi:hypothetical protein
LDAARERFGRLLTSPLRFAELHGSEQLSPRERRRMEPRRMSRRLAIDLVAQAFLKHTDVVSLRVGAPRSDGAVNPPGHEVLLRETGLSRTRMCRAIRDGKRAGYWTAHQPRLEYTNAEGAKAYAAFRVIYRLTDRFFERLGLGRRLKVERDRASERARARRARIFPGPLLRGREAMRRLRARPRAGAPPGAEVDQRRANEIMMRLRHQHPDWDAERIRAEARRLTRS